MFLRQELVQTGRDQKSQLDQQPRFTDAAEILSGEGALQESHLVRGKLESEPRTSDSQPSTSSSTSLWILGTNNIHPLIPPI